MNYSQKAEKALPKSYMNKQHSQEQLKSVQPFPQPINFTEFFIYMLRRAWIMILAGLFGALLAGGYTYRYISPTYQSSATIYIADMNTLSFQDLQLSNSLTVDYTLLANTQNVALGAMTSLGIEDKMSHQQFLSMISVYNPEGSHMLQITAVNTDPIMAADAANAMAEQLQIQIATIMDMKKPSTVQKALVPKFPSGPNMKGNMAKGFIVFAGLVCGICFLFFAFKDTISNEEDVERHLGLPVISTIRKGEHNTIYHISILPTHK